MSNCVFNFNILPLVLSGILGGSHIYIREPCSAGGLLAEKFCTRDDFNFNFLPLVFSEILGMSQIYTIGPYASWTPPSGEIFFTQSEYFTISNCVF